MLHVRQKGFDRTYSSQYSSSCCASFEDTSKAGGLQNGLSNSNFGTKLLLSLATQGGPPSTAVSKKGFSTISTIHWFLRVSECCQRWGNFLWNNSIRQTSYSVQRSFANRWVLAAFLSDRHTLKILNNIALSSIIDCFAYLLSVRRYRSPHATLQLVYLLC